MVLVSVRSVLPRHPPSMEEEPNQLEVTPKKKKGLAAPRASTNQLVFKKKKFNDESYRAVVLSVASCQAMLPCMP